MGWRVAAIDKGKVKSINAPAVDLKKKRRIAQKGDSSCESWLGKRDEKNREIVRKIISP